MKKLLVFILCVMIGVLFFATPSAKAEEIYTTEKLITIDIGKQMLYAWEGGQIVYQTPVSTGLPKSPTVRGSFKIYLKYPVQAHMKGYSPYKGWYDLTNVPNVLYFYKGYGIHGAYWHNNFGRTASNGCVNLPVEASSWLFDFAPVGTRVIVF